MGSGFVERGRDKVWKTFMRRPNVGNTVGMGMREAVGADLENLPASQKAEPESLGAILCADPDRRIRNWKVNH